jgi:SAM-dependent methyltransferase
MSGQNRAAFTPRYYMRHALALKVISRDLRGASFVEFGCGSGYLLADLAERGYSGVGVEPGEEAAGRAALRIKEYPNVRVVTDPSRPTVEKYGMGIALEVLEHVPDDLETLRGGREWLEGGAVFIASVPAYGRLWTEADEVAGHLRRYERQQLESLFVAAGFEIESLLTYGYPLTALTRKLRRRHMATRDDCRLESPTRRTLVSSSISELPARRTAGYALLGRLGHWAQLPFLRSGLGDGFFVIARLK